MLMAGFRSSKKGRGKVGGEEAVLAKRLGKRLDHGAIHSRGMSE